jgi:SAM-dependent methyltransferase
MLKKISKNIQSNKLNNLPLNFIKFLYAIPKMILKSYYGFEEWHLSSYRFRPYAKAIVEHANKRDKRDSVLEIGCGLGSIIRRLDYKIKLGLDNNNDVLSAARLIGKFINHAKTKISYEYFDITEDDISGQFDLILMPNFAHGIEQSIIKEKIEKLYINHLNPHGEIIYDAIVNREDLKSFNLSIEYLTENINPIISKLEYTTQNRATYVLYKKY